MPRTRQAPPRSAAPNSRTGAIRRRPASENAATPPRIDPSPRAAPRTPAPASPRPSTSSARSTNSTSVQPTTKAWAASRNRMTRASRPPPSARMAAVIRRHGPAAACRRSRRPRPRRRDRSWSAGAPATGSRNTSTDAAPAAMARRGEHRARRPEREHDGRRERAGHLADALDGAGDAVRRRELLGRARELREQRPVGRRGSASASSTRPRPRARPRRAASPGACRRRSRPSVIAWSTYPASSTCWRGNRSA